MDTLRTNESDTIEIDRKRDSAIEIKGSAFTLPVLKLKTPVIDRIEQDLKQHLAKSLSFFRNAPIVIDLEDVRSVKEPLDFNSLNKLMRSQKLVPVAIQKGSLEQNLAAEEAGFAILTGKSSSKSANVEAVSELETSGKPGTRSGQKIADQEQILHDVSPTKVIKQPIRSGQRIYARGGDLLLLAAVNAGAEVMADGNIHIYAPIRGRALAGVNGNEEARIFCHSFEAELVAVAGAYRVFEDTVPAELYQKSVQVYLDGEH